MAAATGEIVFVAVNTQVGVVAHGAGFTVIEITASEDKLVRGDPVAGDWATLGLTSVMIGGRTLGCYVQGTFGGRDDAVGMARRIGR
jgi:hypothetical protein